MSKFFRAIQNLTGWLIQQWKYVWFTAYKARGSQSSQTCLHLQSFCFKPLCFLLILKTLLIKSQPWSSSPKPNPWGGFKEPLSDICLIVSFVLCLRTIDYIAVGFPAQANHCLIVLYSYLDSNSSSTNLPCCRLSTELHTRAVSQWLLLFRAEQDGLEFS